MKRRKKSMRIQTFGWYFFVYREHTGSIEEAYRNHTGLLNEKWASNTNLKLLLFFQQVQFFCIFAEIIRQANFKANDFYGKKISVKYLGFVFYR
jgi:hypothetical protein